MRSVDEHLRQVLDTVAPLGLIELPLLDAHGCVLGQPVTADVALPRFDNSSMDGYAVRFADVSRAAPETPVTLPVVGDIAAGSSTGISVQPGLCARIMTGAAMPAGADCVVPLEWTDGGLAQVRITRAPKPGDYVRRAGEDVQAGRQVLSAGTLLAAPQIGLLAALGHQRALVHPPPRVVVISTGSELVEPGETPGPGQIVDSNGYALAAAAHEAGAVPYRVGIVADDPRRLTEVIEDHLIQADVVVTSGGVSVGAYDVVKDVLGRLGDVTFARVAMQPGMPQAFGTIGPDRTPVFGLPGNPVSALVSFEVFVRPALRRMLGAEPLGRPQVPAVLTAAVTSPPGKRQYLRVRVEHDGARWVASPVGGTGSHLLAPMAASNGLAVVPEDVTEVAAGQTLTTWMLERRGR
ncbi:MAG TPA: gephyrin-like molybdotransferase Glp [Mycobacteriales bacterium]|nr:gephyrin-like molybdotransferase Glp [Mycobacteriales bacterium]